MIDIPTHKAILYFGYDPACRKSGLPDFVIDSLQPEPVTYDQEEAIQLGKKALINAVKDELRYKQDGGTHVVPISAGLDSRAILSTLFNHTDIDNNDIMTITFGVEGLWDFEIGQSISDYLGLENITIDLHSNSFDWSEQKIRQFVSSVGLCPVRMFEAYAVHEAHTYFQKKNGFDDIILWNGFFGGPTTKSLSKKNTQNAWSSACESFINRNRFTSEFDELNFRPLSILPNQKYISSNQLPLEDQLNFAHRQMCFISPILMKHANNYATPFANKKWLSFILNTPTEFRKNRTLFKKMLYDMYPDIFSLPSDKTMGLPLTTNKRRLLARRFRLKLQRKISPKLDSSYIYPGKNYLDFNRKFRESGELRKTAKSLLESYDERDLKQIDAIKIWKKHQSGEDYNREIRAICSVELYLSEGMQKSC